MIKNFINKILLTEQTIKAIGGIKETDKKQLLIDKRSELENMNTQGFYKQDLKDITQKPQIEEIKKLRRAEKEIEKEIKDNAILKNEDMLFNSLTIRKALGKRSKQQMNKDLKMISNQLQDLKNNSKENDNYRQNLKIVLKRFFSLGKMSSRYIIIPLSSQIPSDNILKIMNTSKDKESHLFNYMRDNREIIVDALDEEIVSYMSNNGYNFKKENDIYDNLCYTKNNAAINLLDELKKIGANVKNIDTKKKLLANKDPKTMEYKSIENEIKKLSEYRPEFEKRIEDIVDNKIDDVNVKDLKVVVLTWVPRMIMTQSTGTIWKSCMSLEHVSNKYEAGSNARFVASGIQEGIFIAWLVNFNDIKTVNDPIARILIKPFVLQSGEIVWWPSQIYHDGREANELRLFEKTCVNYMIKKQSGLLKKENIVNIRDSKKVYEDSGDRHKKIIFYNKKMEIEDFIIAADLDADKVIEYINNLSSKNINIENDFETINHLFNKIYKLNNFSLIKIFIDKVAILIKEDNVYARENSKRFLSFLESASSEKINKIFDKTFIYFLETFRKIDINLDIDDLLSGNNFIYKLFMQLLENDNFEFINYLFQTEMHDLDRKNDSYLIIFIAMNIIKNNKYSFPYLLKHIQKQKTERNYQYNKIINFLYLLSDIKNVKNFFDNNFKDYKTEKSFSENVLLSVYQIIEKINDYHIKDSNKIKKSIISNLLSINDFQNFNELIRFFGDNYDFIDDELAEKIINSKIFKNEKNIYLKKINFDTNKKFLYAYLEKFIASNDVRLLYLTLEKFASDSFDEDNIDIDKANEILNFIFLNLKKHDIKINIKNIFNYCIRKLEKKDSLDLIMNLIDLDTKEKIENIVYFYFFLLINNKQAEDFLVKNEIKKQKIINYIKKAESDNCEEIFDILQKADVFLSNEKEFENFLNKNKDFFDALSQNSKYHSMIEYMRFNNRNFYLIFVLFSLKNNHYAIRNNFDYLKYHIFKFFSFTLIKDFNSLEKQLHEHIKQSFAKTNPETVLGDLKIDINFIRNIYRNREIVFTIRFLYPMMKDFFESDFFEKIIKKINAITGNHKEMTEKLNFLQNISVSYGEKIKINDIPKSLIKIIDKNKALKNDLNGVKS